MDNTIRQAERSGDVLKLLLAKNRAGQISNGYKKALVALRYPPACELWPEYIYLKMDRVMMKKVWTRKIYAKYLSYGYTRQWMIAQVLNRLLG